MVKASRNEISSIVGKQLKSLLEQSKITVVGLAHGIEMSTNHVRMIVAGKASISSSTAEKIATFFGIDVSQIFSHKPIKLTSIKNNTSLKKFCKENSDNASFFSGKKNESSLMFFLRNELLSTDFLKEYRDVKDVRLHCKSAYGKSFTSKAISAQLVRLHNEGTLSRRDKYGNGSVYLYRISIGHS